MTESKYYTPPSIVCDIAFGRLHSFVCDKAFIEELKKKEIEFITTNVPFASRQKGVEK